VVTAVSAVLVICPIQSLTVLSFFPTAAAISLVVIFCLLHFTKFESELPLGPVPAKILHIGLAVFYNQAVSIHRAGKAAFLRRFQIGDNRFGIGQFFRFRYRKPPLPEPPDFPRLAGEKIVIPGGGGIVGYKQKVFTFPCRPCGA
jgi:hypothetical protein